MTYLARTAERPLQQDEVGRDLIVRRTRAAMQDRPRTDLSRQEIAKSAGVTPALISYYFPDRSSLFEAVVTPIIDEYHDELSRVFGTKHPLSQKLKSIIRIYLTTRYREGNLLDFYINFRKNKKKPAGLERLIEIEAESVAFVGALLDEQCILGECAYTVQSTIWGMCKQVARRSGIETIDGPSLEGRIAAETDLIYDFFMNGVAIVHPVGASLHASQA